MATLPPPRSPLPPRTLDIGLLAYAGVNALDLTGPMEALTAANTLAQQQGEAAPYRLFVLGLTTAPVRSESGLCVVPDVALEDAPATLDTLIIPGGSGLRVDAVNRTVVEWLRKHAARFRRVATVCTGIYGLAPTGLLDGRRVTTHWRFAADVARRFPAVHLEPDAIFIADGAFFTSAGVVAGIDLTLALIEQDCGRPMALAVARDLVVYLKREGGQTQYSAPLQLQAAAQDRYTELCSWLHQHLHESHTVESMAARVHLSPRQFSRGFTTRFGVPPAEFIEDLRLNEAQRLIDETALDFSRIAAAVGFRSADVFRRAFTRRFHISPSEYRLRFGLGTEPQSAAPPN